MQKTVLIADNDLDFLLTRAERLEEEGYRVYQASSPAEVEALLATETIHVAVLDVRLSNDEDDKDTSGLTVAKNKAWQGVPKIIFTRWPGYELVRAALGSALDGVPAAVDFIAKQEGADAMLAAIQRVFAHQVTVNWELEIKFGNGHLAALHQLATMIEPGLDGQQLLRRTEELEELLRRLFLEEQMIRLERLLWQRGGSVAVTVFAFVEGKKPQPWMVICGGRDAVSAHAHRYGKFAPATPGHNATVLHATKTTIHLAASTYALAGAELQEVFSLKDAYRTLPEKSFQTLLQTLLERTLGEWHENQPVLVAEKTLTESYRECLGLVPGKKDKKTFREQVQAITKQSLRLGMKLHCEANQLTLQMSGQSFTYPDPSDFLYQATNQKPPVLLITSPGTISGENVLTDAGNHLWLTDFADAGLVPALWHFVSLEALVRFDWIDHSTLQPLRELEAELSGGDFFQIEQLDWDISLRKAVRTIQAIRRLAFRAINGSLLDYHQGILFQAISRLAKFDHRAQLMPVEVARFTHLLLVAAMISDLLAHASVKMHESAPSRPGIQIDSTHQLVLRDGVRLPLHGQAYNLLLGFYQHANQFCTRQQIIEEFLGETYYEGDESQVNRLNKAIQRLRVRIEYDPEHPRFLLTEPKGGYRFIAL